MKKCNCGAEYTQYTTMQNCCVNCLAERVVKNRVRSDKSELQTKKRELINEKRAVKARLLELKPLSYFKGLAQKALNKWVVHVRDKGLPCISCNQHKSSYEAGHYLARSIRKNLALDEQNIHAQCTFCNNFSKNAHHDYRFNLIAKIGREAVERLEADKSVKKWLKSELLELEAHYKKLLKENQNE